MRSLVSAIMLSTALLATAPATAKPKFAAYEGPDSIKTGEGGTRVTKGGVDFWTTGSPPRKYQIIGIMTDSRYNWERSAIGSAGVAKQVLGLGGDAVVLLGQKDKSSGVYAIPAGSSIIAGEDVKEITQLLVVKYLD